MSRSRTDRERRMRLRFAAVLWLCLAAAAGADPAEPFAIYLGNNTDKDLFLALHYRKPAVDPWVTEGFWKIPAKARIPLTTACDTELYIYAESALGYFGGGDKTLPVGEKPFPRDLPFRRVLIEVRVEGNNRYYYGEFQPEVFEKAQTLYNLYFRNDFTRRIRFLLHYQDLSGEWVTSDWFEIDAGELKKAVETRNRTFYIYGESGARKFRPPEGSTKTIKVKLRSYTFWLDAIPEGAPVPVFSFVRTFENYRIED